MHILHTGRQRHPLPGTEEPMITLDFRRFPEKLLLC
jgi:hypothetical protein